jgi:hypothetical protein
MARWIYGTPCDPGLAWRLSESFHGVEYASSMKNIFSGSRSSRLGPPLQVGYVVPCISQRMVEKRRKKVGGLRRVRDNEIMRPSI